MPTSRAATAIVEPSTPASTAFVTISDATSAASSARSPSAWPANQRRSASRTWRTADGAAGTTRRSRSAGTALSTPLCAHRTLCARDGPGRAVPVGPISFLVLLAASLRSPVVLRDGVLHGVDRVADLLLHGGAGTVCLAFALEVAVVGGSAHALLDASLQVVGALAHGAPRLGSAGGAERWAGGSRPA